MKLRVDAKLSKNQGGRPQGDSGRLERDVKSNTSEKASTSTSHATLPNFRGKRVEMDTAECRDEEDEERQFSSEKTNRKSKLLYKQAKYIKGLEYKVSESEEKVKELSFTLVDKGVENALNAARCKELEKEIKQLRNNANKSDITEEEQNKIDTINEEKDKLIADVDEANASIKDLERKGKDDQNKMQEMRLKMDKSSAGYSSLQQRMEEATDMNEKLLQELTTMNQDLETQDNLHQELQSNIGVLDDERNKLAADLDEANASIKDLEQKRKDDQDTMRETRLEMDKSNADYSSLRQRIKEATDTNEKLLQKFANLNQEQETQDNLHQELKELQSNIGVLDDERNKVIADCDEANASIKDLEETHKDDQKAIQEMRLKMDESSAGYSSLQQRMKEATDMNERLQKELTNLDQDLETQHSIQLTIDILEDERNKVIADLDEANASIKDLEEKRKDDQNTMQEVRLEMDKCNAGYSSLQNTNERLKQEITNLNQGLECREKTSACSDCIRLREKQIMLNKDIEVKKHQFEDCVSSLRQELEAQIKKSEDNAADKNHILEIEKKNNQFQQELFKLNLKLKSQTEEKVQAVKGNDTLQSELKKIGSTIVCMKLEIQHLEEQKILTAKDYDDLMREKRSVELEREELAGRLDALIMNEVDDSNTNVAGVTTIEKFERTEEENQMLRALLEEGECNTSSDDLEELEERLFTIVQVKDTEIAILAEERSGLLAETSALGDRVQMLEGELKRLQDEHGARSSGIDKLKKKRDRKKKTIEERLRAYESSSSVPVGSVVSMDIIDEEDTASTMSSFSSISSSFKPSLEPGGPKNNPECSFIKDTNSDVILPSSVSIRSSNLEKEYISKKRISQRKLKSEDGFPHLSQMLKAKHRMSQRIKSVHDAENNGLKKIIVGLKSQLERAQMKYIKLLKEHNENETEIRLHKAEISMISKSQETDEIEKKELSIAAHFNNVEESSDDKKKVITSILEEQAKSTSRSKDDQHAIQEMRLKMNKSNAEYTSLQKRMEEATDMNEKLLQELTNLNQEQETQDNLHQELQELQSNIGVLGDERNNLAADLDEANTSIKDLEQTRKDDQNTMREMRLKMGKSNARYSLLQQRMEEATDTNEGLQKKLINLNQEVETQDNLQQELQSKIDDLKYTISSLQANEAVKYKELQWLEKENEELRALQDTHGHTDNPIGEKENKISILKQMPDTEIDILVKERDDQNEKFERTEEENQMLRALLEEGECNTSSDDLEELEERLFTIVQVKDTEIAILAEERSGLLAETSALGDRVQMLEGELKRLQDEHGARSSGIDKLKKKRDRKKKTIEERLRAYESSSSVCSVVSKNKVRPRRY